MLFWSPKKIGLRLKTTRQSLGVSAIATAEAAGISRVTLHRVENGKPTVNISAYVRVGDFAGSWSCNLRERSILLANIQIIGFACADLTGQVSGASSTDLALVHSLSAVRTKPKALGLCKSKGCGAWSVACTSICCSRGAMSFTRPHHQKIAAVLASLDALMLLWSSSCIVALARQDSFWNVQFFVL